MTEDNKEVQSSEANTKSAPSKSRELREKNKPLTKIIIRRLPPSMEEEHFLEQISPIPDYDHFYFVKPDSTLGSCAFSRAYLNFVNVDDIFVFRDKFDGYVFLDEKGVEYPGVVEYAPFQRIPKKRRKKDPKCASVESDPIYLEFIESLKETDNESKEPKLEFSYQPTDDEKPIPQSTPLLEFLAARRAEKARVREERRLRDVERRKPRVITDRRGKDVSAKDEIQDIDIKKIKPRDNEKDKPTSKKRDEFTSSRNSLGYSDIKESKPFGKPLSKSYKDQKRLDDRRKDFDKKEPYKTKDFPLREPDGDKSLRKDKKDKRDFTKEKVKEVKKYSDTRKDREKFKYAKSDSKEDVKNKSDDSEKKDYQSNESKTESKPESKMMKFGGDIIPVTKLPVMEDLSRVIDEMDKSVSRLKLESGNSGETSFSSNDIESFAEIMAINSCMESRSNIKPFNNPIKKPFENTVDDQKEKDDKRDNEILQDLFVTQKKGDFRRNSLESGEFIEKEENPFRRHKSLEDKSKSEEREMSEKEDDNKSCELSDSKVEKRRIRNKDRPSIVIYQPGMGKFSKNRITKDKESSKQSFNRDSPEVKEN